MKKLTLQEFVSQASPDDCRIFHVGDGRWEVRCQAGVLAPPNGKTGFDDLIHLLSVLASVGIRCTVIEWDGLPTRQFEQANFSTQAIENESVSLEELGPFFAWVEQCNKKGLEVGAVDVVANPANWYRAYRDGLTPDEAVKQSVPHRF